MGFDVHPAVAGYGDPNSGMGFDVHPAMAGYGDAYGGGMGFDVHPAVAGDESMGDDFGADEAMADSGDGLGMSGHDTQAGIEDMGSYVPMGAPTGAFDEGQGAYVASGVGAYVPTGTGAYGPAPAMGAYVPMNGVDAEEIAAMLFGGPWALARLNQLRHRRRHRHRNRRVPHHPHRRGRWLYDPHARRFYPRPLADADAEGDGEEWTAEESRRQRGVMGIDEMRGYQGGPLRHFGRGRHSPRHHHHGQRHRQRPMHLECDFYLPHYEGYRPLEHRPVHVRPPYPRTAPAQHWHPMHAPPTATQHAAAQPMPQHLVPSPSQPTLVPAQQAASSGQPGPLTGAVANAGGIFASNS
jgi:hypothetical protein